MSSDSAYPPLAVPYIVPSLDAQSNDSESDGPATPVDAVSHIPWLTVPLHFSYDQPYPYTPTDYSPTTYSYDMCQSSQDSSASSLTLDYGHPSGTVDSASTYLSYESESQEAGTAIHAPTPLPSQPPPVLDWTGFDTELPAAVLKTAASTPTEPTFPQGIPASAASTSAMYPPVSHSLPAPAAGHWQFVPYAYAPPALQQAASVARSYTWPPYSAPPSPPPPAPHVISYPLTTPTRSIPVRQAPALSTVPSSWPPAPAPVPTQYTPTRGTISPLRLQPSTPSWSRIAPAPSGPSTAAVSEQSRHKRKRDDDDDDEDFGLAINQWPAEKRARYVAAAEKRRRALADHIGFVPTDPETISLQDKKRAYVECMEQYIEFLHAQLRLVGHEPVAMQKAGGYSGMNTRSIRTLAVHMQTVVRQAQVRVLNEERTFLAMSQQRDEGFLE